MSVVVVRPGRLPEEVLLGLDGFGLVVLRVGDLNGCNQTVTRTPTSEEPDHASVIGPKTHSIRRQMASLADWVIPAESPVEQN
jgi:hypothetical protein